MIEDPIEYLHRISASVINQRELGSDTKSFAFNALKACCVKTRISSWSVEMRGLRYDLWPFRCR